MTNFSKHNNALTTVWEEDVKEAINQVLQYNKPNRVPSSAVTSNRSILKRVCEMQG